MWGIDEELASTILVLPSTGDEYNPALCIICQKNKKGVKVRSTLNGRRKVIDAANICNVLSPMSATKDTHYWRR